MKRRFAFDFSQEGAAPVPPPTPRNAPPDYSRVVEENAALRARVYALERQNKALINYQAKIESDLVKLKQASEELNDTIFKLQQSTRTPPYAP